MTFKKQFGKTYNPKMTNLEKIQKFQDLQELNKEDLQQRKAQDQTGSRLDSTRFLK